jgi:hypothetical protein
MANTKIKASTQKFTEVQNIRENIVLLQGQRACLIMQVTATNFSLLSKEEQDSRMFAYASLLNSLSFPVEILVRNKNVQIEPYLKLLAEEADKTTNAKLATDIRKYKDFVENLIKTASVLDKQFYIILPFTSLEAGLKGASTTVTADDEAFFGQAKSSLIAKAEALMGQIERISLHARVLERDELVRLFYEIYNPENDALQGDIDQLTKSHLVQQDKPL